MPLITRLPESTLSRSRHQVARRGKRGIILWGSIGLTRGTATQMVPKLEGESCSVCTLGRTRGDGRYLCSAASGGYLWECVRGRALTPCRGRAALQHDGRRDGRRLQLSALMLCVFEGCVRDVYCVACRRSQKIDAMMRMT